MKEVDRRNQHASCTPFVGEVADRAARQSPGFLTLPKLEALSDGELFAIIRGEPFAHIGETDRPLISPPHAVKQHARGFTRRFHSM